MEQIQKPRANAGVRKYICTANIECTKEFILILQGLFADGVSMGHIKSDGDIQYTTSVNNCCIGVIGGNEAIIITEIRK
jgi:hypothetical protein